VRNISDAIRNERTTTQTDPFQAEPLGRGELADFPRAHSLRIDSDVLVVRTLKISQLADGESLPDAASCGCMAVKTELGNRRRCGPDHQSGPREMVL
jgi:hypothetical protein